MILNLLNLLLCSITTFPLNIIEKEFEYTQQDIQVFYNEFKHFMENKNHKALDTHIKICKADAVYEGKIIAIDVGGTQLKIGFYDKKFVEEMTHKINLPRDPEYKKISIFAWIAKSVTAWMYKNNIDFYEYYAVSLTFSYPVKLDTLASGDILCFCKDFPFKELDQEKNDPAEMLDCELEELGMNMDTKVILNDTTATFVALMNEKSDCNLGVVLGTGTNGACIKDDKLINLEWGHFDSPLIRKNFFDKVIKYYLGKRQYACIDCMIGGLKLFEMLDLIFEGDTNEILHNFYESTDKGSPENHAVCCIKKRIYTIIAIMTVASVEGDDYVISINGSGLLFDYDKKMYHKSIEQIHILVKKRPIGKIELLSIDNASLKGAIHALRYSGNIGKK